MAAHDAEGHPGLLASSITKYSKKRCIWHTKHVYRQNPILFLSSRYPTTVITNLRSYRVTIPKENVQSLGLKKGDMLTVTSDNERVVFEPEKRREKGLVAFSIGYEGKSLAEFLSILSTNNVKQVIDVRKNAFSFKAGFSKTPLRDSLKQAGIIYIHMPQLGTDQESRREYRETGDIQKLFEMFSRKLDKNLDSYEILKAHIHYRKSALMCFEDDYSRCHRSIIESKLKGDSISVVHLCNGKQSVFS